MAEYCTFRQLIHRRNATYDVNYSNLDYSMRYPVPSGEDDTPDEKKIPTTPKVDSP